MPVLQVTNEPVLLAAINATLAQRGKGEQLVVYSSVRGLSLCAGRPHLCARLSACNATAAACLQRNFPRAADLVAYMAANVAALIGPHGGALVSAG